MSAGTIMNKLSGFPLGMDISLNHVERALRQLEGTYVVECEWRLKETPIQSEARMVARSLDGKRPASKVVFSTAIWAVWRVLRDTD